MGPRTKISSWLSTLLICCCSITLPVAAFAANVSTSKATYVPGERVTVHGQGWRAGEHVSLAVTPGDATTIQATADASGEFINSQYTADVDEVGQQMTLTATGSTSGSAQTIFANAAANLDQGSNGEPGDPLVDRSPVTWVNGNLNPQDTHFAEGMSIPYRMVMTNLTNGTHNLVIGWDTRDGSLAALDYLTHFQRLEPHSQFLPTHPAEAVQPLDNLTGPFGAPSTFAIPVPANGGSNVPGMPTNSFNALPAGERVLTIWNGTINSIGTAYNSQDSLNLAHSQSELTINFTSTSPTVVISWGGHIARKDEWNGQAHPNGSPYHMRNIELDGQGGNQDRSLKSEAVLSCEITGPSPCASTTNQYCVTTNVSQPTYAWSFTSNTSGATFSGPTNGSCVNVNAGTGGGYSLRVDVLGSNGGITCTHDFVVTALPTCSIDGPSVVCPGASQQFCAPMGMASYKWTLTGTGGSINGSSTDRCVTVDANPACGSYTLNLEVANSAGCKSTCTKPVSVSDTQAPTVASCPTDQTIQCPATPTFGEPSFSDNCDASLTITFNDVTNQGSCAGTYDKTRTWTAKDDCNNQITCSQTIHVVDTTKPTLSNVPADATVECDNVPPPPTNVTASDTCDPNVPVELHEAIVILESNPPQSATACTYEITRTWTATDDCGNTATASQKLTVHDGTSPQVASCPTDDTIQCPAVPSFGTPQFTDNCDTDLTVTFDDVRTDGACPGAYDVTRTWTAKDNCNNQVTCSQTIHVVDTTKPTFANVPADATVECDNVPPPGNPTASDTCDPDVPVELHEAIVILESNPPQSATACTYEITRTWTATDDCGNTATASQKLTVHDSTSPQVASCPADDTIQCPATPSFGTPQFTDNCDTDLTVTFDDVRTNGACAGAYDVTRTWTAKDNCNNQATCSQTIHVVDTTKPTFANVPADATVECDNVPPPGNPTASDTCDPDVPVELHEAIVILESNPPQSATACTYEITRTWTATDDCGNTATASQKLTVHDSTSPQVASCPADDTIQCPAVPSFGTPQFTDNCDTDLTVTFDDVRTNSTVCVGAYDVTRTWTAKDNCQNQVTCSQTIHVIDTNKPTFANVPADATVECSAVPPPPDNVTASDTCDPNVEVELHEAIIILESNPPQSATSCTYEITRTWTATDDCGNTAVASQKLTVHDSTSPQVASCPADDTIQCPAAPSFGTPQFTDNCDTELTVTFDDVRTNSTTCANAYDVTRTWTAKDNCQNQVTCSQTIHVVDTTAPALVCPADIRVGACEPVNFTINAPDACGGNVTIVATPPSGSTFPLGETTVNVSATDVCGNRATCSFKVTVDGTPTATITGDDAVCDGATTQLCGPDGNYSWAWTGPGGFQADTRCITVGAEGNYHLVLTDLTHGCTSNGDHALTVNPKPVCSITGPTETCTDTPVQLCGPDGNYGYAWSGPAGYHADTKCISVSAAGSYSLVVTDLATKCSSNSCSHNLQVNTCIVNCPRTPGFWAAQCGGGGGGSIKFNTAAMTTISECVDAKAGIFNWAAGTDFSRFCSTVTKTGNMDQRLQAKRQFAAFLANMCAGENNLIANNGDHVYIDPNSPVACSGLTSTTMGGIVTEVDALMLSLEGQSLTSPAVKAKYSQIIGCLDAINNAEGASVCASAAAANEEYKDYDAGIAALGTGQLTDVVELYRPSPNPFSNSTRIAYVVRGTGENVHIGVYDVSGRRMKVLTDGFQAPGRYELSWDGSAENGVRANNGVYFVRSVVAGKVQTMRVIYVK